MPVGDTYLYVSNPTLHGSEIKPPTKHSDVAGSCAFRDCYFIAAYIFFLDYRSNELVACYDLFHAVDHYVVPCCRDTASQEGNLMRGAETKQPSPCGP